MLKRTPKEDLLVGGLDDWVDAGWATRSARLSGPTGPVALRDSTLALIAEVLMEGLMVAGDIVANDHVPWPGTVETTIDRITREWIDEWGTEIPTPGAVVWLNNTPAGDEIAHSVLRRERHEPP